MHHRAVDITGLRVGYLTALRYHGSDGKKSLWVVRCDCGVEKLLCPSELKKQKARGILASCGCMKRASIAARRTSHGMSKHPAFAVWRSMLDRCYLPTHQAWARYGGRGIQVCARWRESFESFWADMGPTYREGLTLDRIDVNKGYATENCRWATVLEQQNNRRDNLVLPNGQTAAQYADSIGLPRSTIYYRLAAGVPFDKLGAPSDVRNRFTTS